MRITRSISAKAIAAMYLAMSLFGDGSDGDVTINGPVTLTRDMNYRNLTIAAGAALNTGGFEISVQQKLDITAAPTNGIFSPVWDGGDAAGTVAGAAPASPSVGTGLNVALFGVAGKAGGTAAGTAGANSGNAGFILSGGPPGTGGGAGGTGSSGAGGAVGTYTAPRYVEFRRPVTSFVINTPVPACGAAPAGGGSGGGDGTAGGGSGAGPTGGLQIAIYAHTIVRSSSNPNPGVIVAKSGRGGNGGVPAGGNRGGGGGAPGGGGGNIYILCAELTGSTHANALDVSGGKGGDGGAGTGTGTAGQGGQAGFGGVTQVINLSTGAINVSNFRTIGGTANAGATGGASVAARADL